MDIIMQALHKAPPVTIYFSYAIIIIGVITFAFLLKGCFSLRSEIEAALRGLNLLIKKYPRIPLGGLSLEAFDNLSKIFANCKRLIKPWDSLKSSFVDLIHNSETQYWRGSPSHDHFNEKTILDKNIHRSFYTAMPSILTGLGLLGTFVALLIALLKLHYGENGQIQGIEDLINGLSGKFISSIVALSLAVLFTFGEKKLFNNLENSIKSLNTALDEFCPLMTPTALLARISSSLHEQSNSFQHFNTDLSTRLTTSVSEGIGPSINQMITVIEDLNQVLRQAEAAKQDSITGSVEGLLTQLKDSMSDSLANLGSNFSQSLSGSTMSQFEKIASSLEGAGNLIEGMNRQSMQTQEVLSEVVKHAKNSTTEQIDSGKKQIEELSLVMKGLISQMNESTGSSLDKVSSTLTAVVHQLSQEVTELNEKLSQNLSESAGRTTDAAKLVIEKADAWSEKSHSQLDELLAKYSDQFTKMTELRAAMEESLHKFKDAIQNYNPLISDIKGVVGNISGLAGGLSVASKEMGSAKDGFLKIAMLSGEQINLLNETSKTHRESLDKVLNNLQRYNSLFESVEKNAAELFGQIDSGLKNYERSSSENLSIIVSKSDELVSNAVKKLHDLVNDLHDLLEDFHDTAEKKLVNA